MSDIPCQREALCVLIRLAEGTQVLSEWRHPVAAGGVQPVTQLDPFS